MFKNIYLYIDLEIGNVDYVFIFIDIDMVILAINSESMFISIIIKRTLKTLITVFPSISVFFDCALFVQVIHEVASSIHKVASQNFASLVLRACYTISLVILKNTTHCVSTDLSVFWLYTHHGVSHIQSHSRDLRSSSTKMFCKLTDQPYCEFVFYLT